MAMPALRHGALDPMGAYRGLRRIVDRWRHPNGLIWAMAIADYGHAGAWTETLGICGPLEEMMLQSYGQVIRLFPQWPKDVAARFTTFRAEGAFLVSAACSDGEVIDVEVSSEAGGPCRFYPPWDGLPRVETAQGTPVPLEEWAEGILSFDTTPGAKYRILPPQQP